MAERSDFQNRKKLLLHLLDYGNATKQNLVQWTGLSNTTVSDTINAMLKTGFVHVVGRQKSIGGRRSVIYSIDEGYGQFAGVELREQEVHAVLCNARGQVRRGLRVVRKAGELSINVLYRAVDTLLELPEASDVLALGIGVEGQIDHDTQTVLRSELHGWKNVPLKEVVERRVYLPVFIDSTINGQVSLRKHVTGAACPAHFAVLNASFPYKAALCLDGKVCRGSGNQCGRAQSFSWLTGHICSIRNFLGLEHIWIACQSRDQLEEVRQTLGYPEEKDIELYLPEWDELAWGMALVAETKWFGTIYSCTKNPICAPQDSM